MKKLVNIHGGLSGFQQLIANVGEIFSHGVHKVRQRKFIIEKFTLTLCVLCAFVGNSIAQTNYDIFTYTKPKGYKQEDKQGYRLFTKTNKKNNSYCLLSLYTHQKSTGSLQQDFNSEWNTLVATTFNITAPPEIEQGANSNGYEIMGGSEAFKFEGKDAVAIQYVYSGYGKMSTVLAVMNSMEYMDEVEKFIDNVKPIAPTNTTIKEEKEVLLEKSNPSNPQQPTSIIGEWLYDDGLISVLYNYTNTGTNDVYNNDVKSSIKNKLLIKADGRYEDYTFYNKGSFTKKEITAKGDYTITGNTITFKPTYYQYIKNDKVQPKDGTSNLKQTKANFDFVYDEKAKAWGIKLTAADADSYFPDEVYLAASSYKKSNTTTQVNNPTTIDTHSNNQFGNGKMDGVWVSYFLSYVTKGMMIDQKVFLNNNRFLNDMPIGGVDNFTPNEMNVVHSYTLNGTNGKTIDAAGKYPGTFTIKAPNKIELESHTYFKSVNPNGKFITASYSSWSEHDSPEFKAAPIGDRPVIHFTSNGSFEDEGIFKHLQYEDPTKKAGKGTYSIKNYSLYLTYNDGRPTQKFSLASFGEAALFEKANVLILGGGAIFKIKK